MTITAKRTELRRIQRGIALETLVDMVAMATLLLGVLASIGLLLTFSLWGFLASCSVVAGAVLNWLVLRCLAEHIRLQKKIAGCPFEGQISGPREVTIWSCSHCGQMLHATDRCDHCGARIISDDA